jgi:glycosyltransferase involved in cell wall biosynthesis
LACLLKAPEGSLKGCVTFTTQERDLVIKPSPAIRAEIERLKKRFVVGLHHNWHDHDFHYDSLFDFSMAGEGDLIEADGRDFARIPIDACNFAPPGYSQDRQEPFWDILYVARAVAFKGIAEFFQAIRELYDAGLKPRVLFVCPLPEKIELPGIENLRGYFENLFTVTERERVILLTIDWDYPFPLDADTLAFFYRNSRIFFHSAPQERRCRTAAYAWAGGMPVVANSHVASILPRKFRRPPFWFSFEQTGGMAKALTAALGSAGRSDGDWPAVKAEFSAVDSAKRLETFLSRFSAQYGWGRISDEAINPSRLDLRLGRHHGISLGANKVNLPISEFCRALETLSDAHISALCRAADAEIAMLDFDTSRAVRLPEATASQDVPSLSIPGSSSRETSVMSRLLNKIGLPRT